MLGRKRKGVSDLTAEGHTLGCNEVTGSRLTSFSVTSLHLEETSVYLGMLSQPLASRQTITFSILREDFSFSCLLSTNSWTLAQKITPGVMHQCFQLQSSDIESNNSE